ncbi:HIT family protein [Streptomyces sp. NPDC057302]|uniref:HIT family protein n=1 Tax=Streptomyces sp. NPDC057302 TaxID=3346094 RepID=UPI0036338E2E
MTSATGGGDGDSDSGCVACALAAGTRPLPGGTLLRTTHWTVEHCVGPLGIGTLVVKPLRHITGVHEMSAGESAGLGPLLARVTSALRAAVGGECEQVYVCLWSHAGRVPGHIHFVVQPARTADIDRHGDAYGPALQLAMFAEGTEPEPGAVEEFCARMRRALDEDSAI